MTVKICALLLTTIIASIASMIFGTVAIDALSFFKWIFQFDIPTNDAIIFSSARAPRTCAAIFAGMALAISGACMQIWAANPLAGPGLLGLNAGSSCALALAIVNNPLMPSHYLIGIAMLGTCLGAALILLTARFIPGGHTPIRLLLIGAATTAMLTSITACIVIAYGMQNDLLFWLVGGLGVIGWEEVFYLLLAILSAGTLIAYIFRDFSTLVLSKEQSLSLGIHTVKLNICLVIAIVILVGTCTAITGPIAFLGFLAPHIGRGIVGPKPQILLPAAALIGAILVLIADTCARCITAPNEQPFGIFISLLGAPILISVALNYKHFGKHVTT